MLMANTFRNLTMKSKIGGIEPFDWFLVAGCAIVGSALGVWLKDMPLTGGSSVGVAVYLWARLVKSTKPPNWTSIWLRDKFNRRRIQLAYLESASLLPARKTEAR